MISAIFGAVTQGVTGFGGVLVGAASQLVQLFWVTETGGTGHLTDVGMLLCIPLGIGVVMGAYHLVKRLFMVR
ncbi:MAG: hypothetical protein MJ214_05580 [Bacilli bacterium]|nr:hypothetical protein [Bacilli bacterium]